MQDEICMCRMGYVYAGWDLYKLDDIYICRMRSVCAGWDLYMQDGICICRMISIYAGWDLYKLDGICISWMGCLKTIVIQTGWTSSQDEPASMECSWTTRLSLYQWATPHGFICLNTDICFLFTEEFISVLLRVLANT